MAMLESETLELADLAESEDLILEPVSHGLPGCWKLAACLTLDCSYSI